MRYPLRVLVGQSRVYYRGAAESRAKKHDLSIVYGASCAAGQTRSAAARVAAASFTAPYVRATVVAFALTLRATRTHWSLRT